MVLSLFLHKCPCIITCIIVLEVAAPWCIPHILMIFLFSLTFDNCSGPSVWFHWIGSEQTVIMGCFWLIFSLPVVVESDVFTPRSLVQTLHFVLKYLHCCVIIAYYWDYFCTNQGCFTKAPTKYKKRCRLTFLLHLYEWNEWFWTTTDLCEGFSMQVMAERVANIHSFEQHQNVLHMSQFQKCSVRDTFTAVSFLKRFLLILSSALQNIINLIIPVLV